MSSQLFLGGVFVSCFSLICLDVSPVKTAEIGAPDQRAETDYTRRSGLPLVQEQKKSGLVTTSDITTEPGVIVFQAKDRPSNNLIHQSGYFDNDDREVLSKNASIIRFSRAEQEQAMRCTGRLYCPNFQEGKVQSAGAICPPGKRTASGKCSADRLATVAHIFVDKVSNQFIPTIEQCEFSNYRGFTSKLQISDVKVSDPQISAYNPYTNMRADKVVVRLRKPIPLCDPYELPDSSDPPAVGTQLVALTYRQLGLERKFDGSEPLAYHCNVTRTFSARHGGPSMFYSNCDANGGASGGFNLTRNADNKLAVSGMFIRTGKSEDGKPYDESNKNYTISVGTNADFLELVAQPGVKPANPLTLPARQSP